MDFVEFGLYEVIGVVAVCMVLADPLTVKILKDLSTYFDQNRQGLIRPVLGT